MATGSRSRVISPMTSLITLNRTGAFLYLCRETSNPRISTFSSVRSLSDLQVLYKHVTMLEVLIRTVILEESKNKMVSC